jgi:hypothetical protein
MYGYDHPGDPIGPEPSHYAPDQRAAWHQAFAALSPADGPNVRTMPDGRLWLLRDAYAAETSWAPRHPGKELRLARLGAFDADLGAIRADAEAQGARKTGDHDRAARHEHIAASYRALRDHYQRQEQALVSARTYRQEWEQATAGSRHLAIAADAELRRRHPNQKIEALRSAEPVLVGDDDIAFGPDKQAGEATTCFPDLVVGNQAPRATLAKRRELRVPDASLGRGYLGGTPGIWNPIAKEAILQPPMPQIAPSATILQLAAERDTEPEAAD